MSSSCSQIRMRSKALMIMFSNHMKRPGTSGKQSFVWKTFSSSDLSTPIKLDRKGLSNESRKPAPAQPLAVPEMWLKLQFAKATARQCQINVTVTKCSNSVHLPKVLTKCRSRFLLLCTNTGEDRGQSQERRDSNQCTTDQTKNSTGNIKLNMYSR